MNNDEKNDAENEMVTKIECRCPFRNCGQTKKENEPAERKEKIVCPESITIKLCNQFCNPQKDCLQVVLLVGRIVVVILLAVAALILAVKLIICAC